MNTKHPLPDWGTCGKTVQELIKDLRTFEKQEGKFRISLDYGGTTQLASASSLIRKFGAFWRTPRLAIRANGKISWRTS